MELQVIAPEDSIGSWKYDLSNYLMHLDIRPTEIQVNDAQWVTYRSKHMLLVDENAIYEFKRDRPDLVVLRNSPKVNLDRLIRHLKPELIIADGSNYHSYVHLWENSCKKNKTPFHSTLQKGALIIK